MVTFERLDIRLPETPAGYPFSKVSHVAYKPETLRDRGTGYGPRTEYFERAIAAIFWTSGKPAPYAFKTADGQRRSLDAGCMQFLRNRPSPEIDFECDRDGFIIAVRPLPNLLRRLEKDRDAILEQFSLGQRDEPLPPLRLKPMAVWIFQANPARFDIDGFLATRPGKTTWLVTRLGDQIAIGDDVFIWRAAGKGELPSGIIAKATILESVRAQKDYPKGGKFWKANSDSEEIRDRVLLRIDRVANKKEVLQRGWLLQDPVLRNLQILKMANATNYSVDPAHVPRLSTLWEKTGKDFTYAEAVAGLWAYAHTHGKEISKLPNSPVANVALRTGRAVPGIYNKVMNFRSIDPRDNRKGLGGASDIDRKVWVQFFEPTKNTLQESALDAEFSRLWIDGDEFASADIADAAEEAVEREAQRLASLTLKELLAAYARRSGTRLSKPRVKRASTRVFERDPLVVAIAKARAAFSCEVPGCIHSLFVDEEGNNYCEVHHIHPLSEGGDDSPGNVACICPSHHREAHCGKGALSIRKSLAALRAQNSIN